ncbi:pentatricopeptide repeat-containing protein [Hordeum vulgare]|nr:pentatricopeptide repeat-containing protein [Hordeum vulgare]
MPARDVVTWNSMVDGYVSNGLGALVLVCFREMHEALEMQHDGVGIIAVLAACCLESALMQWREIHAYVLRHGMDHDVKVGTSILDMYCKCGDIASAEGVFATMPSRTVVTWNCMIGGYALNERPEEAFDCSVQMKVEGHQVEVVTAINLLAACAQTESSLYGRSVHGYITRRQFLPHVVLETALLEMYNKVGKVKSSEKVFGQMTTKTLVSWNNMTAAYMYKEMYMEAITLFLNLLNQPLYPDYFTMSSVVPTFVLLGLLRQCRQMHNYIIRLGYGESTLIMNAVMHMYARKPQPHEPVNCPVMRNFGAQLLKNAQGKAKNPTARPVLQRAHVKPVPPPPEHVIKISSDTDVTKSEAGSISSVRKYSRKKVVTTLRHVLLARPKVEINAKMRGILVDHILEVHHKFDLMPESLYLTIYIIDMYLSLQLVLRWELQLVGVSALLIACKYEEIWAPEVNDFILISDNACMREQILKMEKAILNRLEWNLTMPMLYVFLVRFAKAVSSSSYHKSDKEMENTVLFFAELALLQYGMVQSKPSTVVAVAVYAARLTLKMTPLWTDTLRHHNGFTEAQLM